LIPNLKVIEFSKVIAIEQENILKNFFSNTNKNVFVLKNMPEVLKGALLSRYSRSSLPLRDLFIKEYVNNEEFDISKYMENLQSFDQSQSALNTEKAKKFYSKWLAMYGDDSIAELSGIHIAVENISVLATKSIEDRRIGISPLEKSTRYVRFDDKVDGKYQYYRDPEVIASKYGAAYITTLDLMFETYSTLLEPMSEYFRNKFPKPEDVSDTAYATSIRAKACDTLRGLLPAATLTNMGFLANGRAVEYLLTKMYATPLTEVKEIAKEIHAESQSFIGNFVERLETESGIQNLDYYTELEKSSWKLGEEFRYDKPTKLNNRYVHMTEYDKDGESKIIASTLFQATNLPYESLLQKSYSMSPKQKGEIIDNIIGLRKARWNRPPKSFEEIYYSFEILSDMGAYKDLMRHRVLSSYKQLFTTELGYLVPAEIIEAGFEKQYSSPMDLADNLYQMMKTDFPFQAQYLTGHGHLLRWRLKMNLREAYHLCELRSSPQGHPSYRLIAQEIYKLIESVHPTLARGMKFVNMQDPGLERLSAEVRKEQRLNAMK